ncbi:MAG: type II toxin-antitoxin system prevent-host-death family antitoxin [Symploca sp. SIO1C4]|uniref:Antitoxin n=1 Tax=Symploca sp. SIO1C4 TaxID=2607765 RepID=A0A6B3NF91_9CYAN|nr:type II toxin-antitoxin system prevent-host-death family antitoxin [Symploca sp. SIO1C4]NET08035.1 type II toxin-antitoxin system prevent-host-death family antitoxin [Symploca sp. SIO2B6]NET50656.1 type II toxin-antitoxin system prevent-host-death family antitoxin [Merismopedia sp. SIO2A8]
MDIVTYSEFRKRLAPLLDKVNEDSAPLLVTRQNGSPVVVMTLEDFKAYEATFYLLSSKKNAKRLDQAIAELRSAKGIERGLIEE